MASQSQIPTLPSATSLPDKVGTRSAQLDISTMSESDAHNGTPAEEQDEAHPAAAPPQIGIKRALPVRVYTDPVITNLSTLKPEETPATNVTDSMHGGVPPSGGLEISFKDGEDGWLIVRVRRYV